MARRSHGKHVSAHLLGMGLSLLGMGLVLLVLSMTFFGSSANPVLLQVGPALRHVLPYPIAMGVLLSLVGYFLRPQPMARRAAGEPTWFPNDSTDFVRSVAEPPQPHDDMPHPGRRPPATQWGRQVFEDIEWRRFETLCAELFAQAGFEPRSQSHGADGGVDIWLHSRHAEGPVAVVQCKHWSGRPVGVQQLREFLGVMTARQVARGTYATTSTFTEEALRFARENGIHTLDAQGLLDLIARRTPEQQQSLLRHAYEGDYWRPTCPRCGVKMVERSSRKSATPFWGCSDFPRCRATLAARQPG